MKRFVPVLGLIALIILVGATALHAVSMSNGAPRLECWQCHMGAKNRPADFAVEGLPSNNKYEPGKLYKITIKITKGPQCPAGASCGGFAVAASAGELVVVDSKDTFISQLPDGTKIITHTKEGSKKREWTIGWKAPSSPTEVTLEISVLAANGDGSLTGDAYAHKTIKLEPTGGGTATQTQKPTASKTVVTETVTETKTITTTIGTKKVHNTGLAVGVAIVIFLVVVGGYLLYARK